MVIERCELLPLVRDTTSGFTKVSIVVRLSGGGHTGEGEDITWDQIDQIELLHGGHQLGWLHGTRTFDELSLDLHRGQQRLAHGLHGNVLNDMQ